jgi:predicted DNA-binding transcriptional regulator AlpA
MERLLTAEEVAEVLKVRVETLNQWRWLGKGPRAIKSGRRFLRYRPADVEAWLEEHAEKTPPAA